MTTAIIRQGDVGLLPMQGTPTLLEGAELVKRKTRLIRKGEHGGKHELATLERANIWDAVLPDGSTLASYVLVEAPTEVVHKEHAPLPLQPKQVIEGHTGWYEIRIQQEVFGSTRVFTGD